MTVAAGVGWLEGISYFLDFVDSGTCESFHSIIHLLVVVWVSFGVFGRFWYIGLWVCDGRWWFL